MNLRRFFNTATYGAVAFFALVIISSCSTYKNTTYFMDIPDTLKASNGIAIPLAKYADPKIQAGDLLYVLIQTIDPRANNITGNTTGATFTTQATSTAAPGTSTMPGYLVDKNGNIELALVGDIKISGLSTSEARDAIRKKAAIYYKDPVVNVRFANFTVSVLGEVRQPAQYTIPGERTTVLDAIAMAGDLTIYGKRENILLLREENGIKTPIRLNLNSSDILKSPYFFLKQNDVIYVEPNKAKVASNDYIKDRNTGYAISIATSLISIAIILLTRVK